MGKLFTTDTAASINVAMTVEPKCFDDRYILEVQSAELRVWNELDRMFCSVKANLELVDSEDPRNTAIVSIEEDKIGLPSLSTQITYRGGDAFVSIETNDSIFNDFFRLLIDDIDRWLEVYVRIEGI